MLSSHCNKCMEISECDGSLAPVPFFFLARSRFNSMAANSNLHQMYAEIRHWMDEVQPHMPEIQATRPADFFFEWLFFGDYVVQLQLIVTLRLLHNFQPRWPSPTTKALANFSLGTNMNSRLRGRQECTLWRIMTYV